MSDQQKRYGVALPIAGSIYVEVDADSEEDAINAAFDVGWRLDLTPEDGQTAELGELETMKEIVRGNVCYAPIFEANAEEIESVE